MVLTETFMWKDKTYKELIPSTPISGILLRKFLMRDLRKSHGSDSSRSTPFWKSITSLAPDLWDGQTKDILDSKVHFIVQ